MTIYPDDVKPGAAICWQKDMEHGQAQGACPRFHSDAALCPSLLCVSCNLSVRLQGQARGRKAAAGRWRRGVCEHHVQRALPLRRPSRSAWSQASTVMAGTTPPAARWQRGKRATPKLRCKRHIAHRERGKHFARQTNGAFKQKAPAAGQRLPQALAPFLCGKRGHPSWPRKRKRCIFLPVSAILKQTEGSKAYDI